jgi:hypothetical protein
MTLNGLLRRGPRPVHREGWGAALGHLDGGGRRAGVPSTTDILNMALQLRVASAQGSSNGGNGDDEVNQEPLRVLPQ